MNRRKHKPDVCSKIHPESQGSISGGDGVDCGLRARVWTTGFGQRTGPKRYPSQSDAGLVFLVVLCHPLDAASLSRDICHLGFARVRAGRAGGSAVAVQ